jgi:hypothetical protein
VWPPLAEDKGGRNGSKQCKHWDRSRACSGTGMFFWKIPLDVDDAAWVEVNYLQPTHRHHEE